MGDLMSNDNLKDTTSAEYNREAEIEKLLQEEHENEIKTTKAKTKKRTLIIVAATIIILGIIVTGVYTTVIIPKGHYEKGEKLLAAKNWDEAIAEFNLAGANEKAQEINTIRQASCFLKRIMIELSPRDLSQAAAGIHEYL